VKKPSAIEIFFEKKGNLYLEKEGVFIDSVKSWKKKCSKEFSAWEADLLFENLKKSLTFLEKKRKILS